MKSHQRRAKKKFFATTFFATFFATSRKRTSPRFSRRSTAPRRSCSPPGTRTRVVAERHGLVGVPVPVPGDDDAVARRAFEVAKASRYAGHRDAGSRKRGVSTF